MEEREFSSAESRDELALFSAEPAALPERKIAAKFVPIAASVWKALVNRGNLSEAL